MKRWSTSSEPWDTSTELSAGVARPRIHVVAVSHLDTQWRWTIRDTLVRHLPATLAENFRRFEEFPNYVVAFDGSFRYRLIEETAPESFAELRRWVAAGRFTLAGAFVDAADVNLPHPESLVRHVLLATRYFESRFGHAPHDVFLPDCFGFGAALPTVAAHCGLNGFSSQKLGRGRAAGGLPFALGVWEGVDGSTVLASLDPGGYGEMLSANLACETKAVAEQLRVSRVAVAQRYFGVGDTGGAPGAESLAWLERALASDGPVEVRVGTSGRLFDDLSAEEISQLPRHRGELLMREHGPGCYTSVAAMKAWNRRNELAAQAAEAAAVLAHRTTGAAYPRRKLDQAWERFLWHQFHDDLTGTSLPRAYAFSLRDEALAHADFNDVLETSRAAVVRRMDTRSRGWSASVFNPLPYARTEVVELELPSSAGAATDVEFAVLTPDGLEVFCQVTRRSANAVWLAFPVTVAGTSITIFELVAREPGCAAAEPPADLRRFALDACAVAVDEDGRVASLVGPAGEALARPVDLDFLPDVSLRFPAWEIRHRDVSAPPTRRQKERPRVTRDCDGPWLVRWRVERRLGASTFVDRCELRHGFPGLLVRTEVDWRDRGTLLKLAVAARCDAPVAHYGLGWGAIARGVNSPERYEVPGQHWAALDAEDGSAGLAVLAGAKYGWDRPRADTLRMTWFHTPKVGRRFRFQGRQDLGRHSIDWALATYRGGWADAGVARLAERFERPLRVALVGAHQGPLGRRVNLLEVDTPSFEASAVKLAQDGDRLILRLREASGRAGRAAVRLHEAIATARFVDGCERPLVASPESPVAADRSLEFECGRFATRSLEIDWQAPPPSNEKWRPLAWQADVFLCSGTGSEGSRGWSFPRHAWPQGPFEDGGIAFELPPADGPVAAACRGQRLDLSPGTRRLALLVASLTGPRSFSLQWNAGAEAAPEASVLVPCWRSADHGPSTLPAAWISNHLMRDGHLVPYRFGAIYRADFDVPAGVTECRLPDEPDIAVFAVSSATDNIDPCHA
jgi:alpha-mannosidase